MLRFVIEPVHGLDSAIDLFPIIDGDDIDKEPGVFSPVNDSIAAGPVSPVTFPLPLQELPDAGIESEPVDRFGDLLAQFPVGMDELAEFLLGKLRKNNGVTRRHRRCWRLTSDHGATSPRLICFSASRISFPSR